MIFYYYFLCIVLSNEKNIMWINCILWLLLIILLIVGVLIDNKAFVCSFVYKSENLSQQCLNKILSWQFFLFSLDSHCITNNVAVCPASKTTRPHSKTTNKQTNKQTNTLLSPDTVQCTRGQNIKQIHRNRRQYLDIYNINTCKLNILKLTIAVRNYNNIQTG